MSERLGVLAGVLSCTFGGMAGAVTRFLVAEIDPVTLAAIRFGVGVVVLLPLALALGVRWPRGRDWAAVALLGLMFFAGFFFLFNLALHYTTAARGALALSALPLVTMAMAAALGAERLTQRKTAGVLVAMGGVLLALGAGIATAPPGAWRGDLVMASATLLMALYSIWARPFIARSSALGFLVAGMSIGAAADVALGGATGGFAALHGLATAQWLALGYLGVFGGGVAFYLWVWALKHASPTRVTATMTVNPVAAGLLASALMDEPIGLNLALGIVAVLAGLWIATSSPRAAAAEKAF